MVHTEEIEANEIWSKEIEYLVPKFTSSILDGVRSCDIEEAKDYKLFRQNKLYDPNAIPHHFKKPASYPSNRLSSDKSGSTAVSDFRKVFAIHHNQDHRRKVRSFIGGLSHCYNNLLMGIWGNTTLIGMILEKEHPVQAIVEQMEALIQNGSNLTQILLGYIVERRSAAKRLRLKQLIQEIDGYNKVIGIEIDLALIEASITELSKIQGKVQLAACISRVMNQMMTLIDKKRLLIDAHRHDLVEAKSHLDKIDALIRRGFRMIRYLDYYADVTRPKRKRVSLKSLVRHQMRKIDGMYPGVTVTRDLSAPLPWIYVDPDQIACAIKQLVDNAMDAVAENGEVHLHVNTLNSEKPHERLCAHRSNNYVVITVSDSGHGMAIETQAKIFDPFFVGPKGSRKTGLGLAAAAGIVKSHGGYIQVRSTPGKGSIFKVYLPI
jgi:signal transduction histidine kinase